MKIFFTIPSFKNHMSSEGNQLQEGLRAAGWCLAGAFEKPKEYNSERADGYIMSTDVKHVLKKYDPTHILFQDPREWCWENELSVKGERFTQLQAVRAFNAAWKGFVLKDAQHFSDRNAQFCAMLGLDSCVHYYDYRVVEALNPWLAYLNCHRVTHSVDLDAIEKLWQGCQERSSMGLLSGALSEKYYPLRTKIALNCRDNVYKRVAWMSHPGYHTRGPATGDFLKRLFEYKVNVATCSVYRYLLRKLIEGVCCGCMTLTNLPLSGGQVDSALVGSGLLDTGMLYQISGPDNLDTLVELLSIRWNQHNNIDFPALQTARWFDYRAVAKRLDADIVGLKTGV